MTLHMHQAEPVARELGIEHLLHTQLEVEDGEILQQPAEET